MGRAIWPLFFDPMIERDPRLFHSISLPFLRSRAADATPLERPQLPRVLNCADVVARFE